MKDLFITIVALILMFLPHYYLGDRIKFNTDEGTMQVLLIIVWMGVVGGLALYFLNL